jgi:hypothetical protein
VFCKKNKMANCLVKSIQGASLNPRLARSAFGRRVIDLDGASVLSGVGRVACRSWNLCRACAHQAASRTVASSNKALKPA